MDFNTAIHTGLRKAFNFSDRAPRSEFWYWYLFTLLVSFMTTFLDWLLGTGGVLTSLAAIVLFVPNISVTVRRLHDIDKSGWWILILFIPLIGWLFLFIWECTKGTLGSNRYGPDPLMAESLQSQVIPS